MSVPAVPSPACARCGVAGAAPICPSCEAISDEPSHLFRLWQRLSGGLLCVDAWEGVVQDRGPTGRHTRIDVEARFNGSVVAAKGLTWCGIPGHRSIDGVDARELVLSLFSYIPDDRDAHTSPEALAVYAWIEQHGDDLNNERQARYCSPEQGEVSEEIREGFDSEVDDEIDRPGAPEGLPSDPLVEG